MSRLDRQPNVTELTPVFAALGDATRLELVKRLGSGRRQSIAQLADGLELSRQGVTKHLRVLERAGLVASQRHGREKRYECVPVRINQARSYLDGVSAQWGAALSRLKAFAEESP